VSADHIVALVLGSLGLVVELPRVRKTDAHEERLRAVEVRLALLEKQ
jgi:hypothetical protein